MTDCMHSAIAPNMNHCIKCGAWLGDGPENTRSASGGDSASLGVDSIDRCLEHPEALGYVDVAGFKRWVALNPGAVSQLIISLFNELPLDTIRPAVIARLTDAPAGNPEQLASLEQRGRECSACKGAGEVMLPVWTPDPQDGYERLGTCPKCGGNGGAFPQALESLLYFTEHCLSAADEGVDYSTSREWLDAMTTMGIMEKTGRGKWAPSDQAQSVVTALRAITAALANQQGVGGAQAECDRRGKLLADLYNCDEAQIPVALLRRISACLMSMDEPQPAGDVGREG